MVDGPCKLLKQSFELPVGFSFLARPTVLECASDQSSQSRAGLLDCWVYQGLLEAYHLRPGATVVAGVGTSKRCCSLTCFVESSGTEVTFLLCLPKPSLPPPKYHCKSIVRQPRILYTFFFFLCKTYIYMLINHVFTNKKEKTYINICVTIY